MEDILRKICDNKRNEIDNLKQKYTVDDLIQKINTDNLIPRDFCQKLLNVREENRFAIIAEIKKASPSKGIIRENFQPSSLAKAYENGGAACLSVLTESNWFKGDIKYLMDVRNAASLPILRKDFIIDAWQIYESKAYGADAILLIAACLNDEQLQEYEEIAKSLSLSVLVEVHNKEEMDRVIKHTTTPLVGVNNRDLKTFDVDIEKTVELARYAVEADRLVISESGLYDSSDTAWLHKNGAKAFLIGENFMRQEDVEAAVKQLIMDTWEHIENIQSNVFRPF